MGSTCKCYLLKFFVMSLDMSDVGVEPTSYGRKHYIIEDAKSMNKANIGDVITLAIDSDYFPYLCENGYIITLADWRDKQIEEIFKDDFK